MSQSSVPWTEKVKVTIKYILAPVLGLLAIAYYILGTRRADKFALKQSEAEKQLAETLAKKEEARNEAAITDMQWDDARKRYFPDDSSS